MNHLLKLIVLVIVSCSTLCAKGSNTIEPFIFVDHYGDFEEIVHKQKSGIFILDDNVFPIVRDLQDYYYLKPELKFIKNAFNATSDLNNIDKEMIDLIKKQGKRKFLIGMGVGAGAMLVIGITLNILIITK